MEHAQKPVGSKRDNQRAGDQQKKTNKDFVGGDLGCLAGFAGVGAEQVSFTGLAHAPHDDTKE